MRTIPLTTFHPPQHHSRIDVQLTAQLPSYFQRGLALAVHDFADTGVAEAKHLCEFCLRDAHLVFGYKYNTKFRIFQINFGKT